MKRGAIYSDENTRRRKQPKTQTEAQQAQEILAPITNPNDAGLALYKHSINADSFAVGTILTAYNNHISYGYKGWALVQAAERGYNNVVSLLLGFSATQMHPQQLKQAYQQAKDVETQRLIFPYVPKF